jgi:ATP-dependent exoDNAse (exonuclease V) beta subunit
MAPPDDIARVRALDTNESFIVEAPAGSGKTTLLTQRLLGLLARSTEPESVLAITFTRKAAAEMRERVLSALADASSHGDSTNAAGNTTRQLAANALLADARHGWNLLQHPSRLRIQTIDSLSHWLAGRLPILSRSGASLNVRDTPQALYGLAARRTIQSIDRADGPAHALAILLRHFDNEVDRLENLLAHMLARRERWLELATRTRHQDAATELRAALEDSLQYLVGQELERVQGLLASVGHGDLWVLAAGAASRMAKRTAGTELLERAGNMGLAPTASMLRGWQALASLLITQAGSFRARLTKNEGFPEVYKDQKRAFTELIGQLDAIPGLSAALLTVIRLPPPGYTADQWQVLQALNAVLVAAAVELETVFAEQGQVDFSAVTHAALRALGEDDEPSDLVLALDYRLQHILVDEFQDTSLPQVQLLARLTAGWQPGDGRTLFLVGDPMQSIYGFRQADVGLFLKVRNQGIGSIKPTALALTANFRSRPQLVDWVNSAFARVFPAHEDYSRGAVTHSAAVAVRPPDPQSQTELLLLEDTDPSGEARAVTALVATLVAQHPEWSIAVLARSRAPLSTVAREFIRHGLSYQGIDLVPLTDRPAIRDLIALTRALAHRGDRTAWLALLRAPFIGLDLESLWRICGDEPDQTLWSLLSDEVRCATLTDDASRTLGRVMPLLARALQDVGRRPLAELVEVTWLTLGGPATLEHPDELANAEAFFARLDGLAAADDLADTADLEHTLGELYALPEANGNPKVQLLTIHRAKGLEWDAVIVVGVDKRSRASTPELLQWLEYTRPDAGPALVLAPHRAGSERDDPLEAWVKGRLREREDLEIARLLYVACTRAREQLYIAGTLQRVADPARRYASPQRGTLLASLWPALEQDLEAGSIATASSPRAGDGSDTRGRALLPDTRRLAADWQPPEPEPNIVTLVDPETRPGPSEFEFEWVGLTARHVGTLVHAELEYIAQVTLARYESDRSRREAVWVQRLIELGVPRQQLTAAVARVRAAIDGTLDDSRGRWLLDASYRHSASELELSTIERGGLVTVRIDRTFVTDDDVRWIVDYKTSQHQGADLERFLDQEQARYAGQLAIYARLLQRREPGRVIRVGLYFPLHAAWREWPADHAGDSRSP